MFARKGVAGATVRDIADEAHILSGSLSHHFESKDQMVEEILRVGFDELIDRYRRVIDDSADCAEAVRGVLSCGIDFMMRNQVVGMIIRNDSRQLEQIPRFAFISDCKATLRELVSEVLRRGVAAGEFRPDLDMEITYYVISDALLGSVRYPSIGDRGPAAVGAMIGDLLVRSLVP